MAETGVKRTRKGGGEVLPKAFLRLMRKEVLVGIPAENAGREEGGPINNAAIGYIMETGSPINNIPPRPWLKPGIQDAKPAIAKAFRAALKSALANDEPGMMAALTRAGIAAETAAKHRIDSNTPPPLAPSTLAKRRRNGRPAGGERTLVDTGQLRNSVHFVIVDERGSKKGSR